MARKLEKSIVMMTFVHALCLARRFDGYSDHFGSFFNGRVNTKRKLYILIKKMINPYRAEFLPRKVERLKL